MAPYENVNQSVIFVLVIRLSILAELAPDKNVNQTAI